ncbi:MAG: DUF4214 domain-containing protein [Burkholderiales bacterium]|nr:DUF4214 domain-containing protein [Burkholderiales bacterium]
MILESGGTYLTVNEAMNFASEFIHNAGEFTVQYWDQQYKRESEPIWKSVNNFVTGNQYDGNGSNFGVRVVNHTCGDRVEFSNVAGNAYLAKNTQFSTQSNCSVLGNCAVKGTNANDVLDAATAKGAQSYDGGDGIDTLRYPGPAADFQMTKTACGHQITGQHGVDTLFGVERLQFTDKLLALDVDGNAGQVYRVYQAAFNRKPDSDGLKFWVKQRDQGATLNEIAGGFIGSAEFKGIYGDGSSHEQFVARLYNNVLHRDYEQSGFTYWTGLLNQGTLSRAQVLAAFAESPENQNGVAATIRNGIDLPL